MSRPMDCAASGQLSLGVAESFPPGDDEIKAWADSSDCVPPETLVDEDDEDGYGFIFRPAQFYETVRAALARWGRPVPPADPIRAALERLVIMASNELASGQLVYSQPEWNDAIAAARAALNAAPSDEPAVPEGREPVAVAGEPSDEELLKIKDGAYCPSIDEVNDEDDSSWQYTSDYIRWLDEDGTPQEQEAYAAKGLRAVFEAGRRWDRPAPPAEGEVGERVRLLRIWADHYCEAMADEQTADRFARAADLLERQAASPAPPPAEGEELA